MALKRQRVRDTLWQPGWRPCDLELVWKRSYMTKHTVQMALMRKVDLSDLRLDWQRTGQTCSKRAVFSRVSVWSVLSSVVLSLSSVVQQEGISLRYV
jgi:hypothetical protein